MILFLIVYGVLLVTFKSYTVNDGDSITVVILCHLCHQAYVIILLDEIDFACLLMVATSVLHAAKQLNVHIQCSFLQ